MEIANVASWISNPVAHEVLNAVLTSQNSPSLAKVCQQIVQMFTPTEQDLMEKTECMDNECITIKFLKRLAGQEDACKIDVSSSAATLTATVKNGVLFGLVNNQAVSIEAETDLATYGKMNVKDLLNRKNYQLSFDANRLFSNLIHFQADTPLGYLRGECYLQTNVIDCAFIWHSTMFSVHVTKEVMCNEEIYRFQADEKRQLFSTIPIVEYELRRNLITKDIYFKAKIFEGSEGGFSADGVMACSHTPEVKCDGNLRAGFPSLGFREFSAQIQAKNSGQCVRGAVKEKGKDQPLVEFDTCEKNEPKETDNEDREVIEKFKNSKLFHTDNINDLTKEETEETFKLLNEVTALLAKQQKRVESF